MMLLKRWDMNNLSGNHRNRAKVRTKGKEKLYRHLRLEVACRQQGVHFYLCSRCRVEQNIRIAGHVLYSATMTKPDLLRPHLTILHCAVLYCIVLYQLTLAAQKNPKKSVWSQRQVDGATVYRVSTIPPRWDGVSTTYYYIYFFLFVTAQNKKKEQSTERAKKTK